MNESAILSRTWFVCLFSLIKHQAIIAEGKVVKLGKECIHVIILGFSSATIMSEDIREEFKFRIVRTSFFS